MWLSAIGRQLSLCSFLIDLRTYHPERKRGTLLCVGVEGPYRANTPAVPTGLRPKHICLLVCSPSNGQCSSLACETKQLSPALQRWVDCILNPECRRHDRPCCRPYGTRNLNRDVPSTPAPPPCWAKLCCPASEDGCGATTKSEAAATNTAAPRLAKFHLPGPRAHAHG